MQSALWVPWGYPRRFQLNCYFLIHGWHLSQSPVAEKLVPAESLSCVIGQACEVDGPSPVLVLERLPHFSEAAALLTLSWFAPRLGSACRWMPALSASSQRAKVPRVQAAEAWSSETLERRKV